MQLFHVYHHFRQGTFQRIIHSDFWLFEFSIWLHTFARSMVSIFIPIFFLTIGYDIGAVIIYYLLFNSMDVPLNFFARYLTRKFGARIVIIVSSLFSVGFFITLYALEPGNWKLFILMAFLAAVYDSFFWVSHLFLFMKCSKNDDNVSEDASALEIVKRLAGVIAPAIGAVILISFNKNFLILISSSILLLSIIPLFKIKDLSDKPARKQKTFKQFFGSWDITKDYISSFFMAIHTTAENIIWPLFIYLFFESIESVAIIPIIVSITAIIFTYFTGRIKKEKRRGFIALGGAMIALVWVSRVFFDNSIFYYGSIFLVGFFTVLITIPLNSYIFEKGEKRDTLSASTYRNVASMSANFLFFFVLALLINVFNISFLIASGCMLLLVGVSYFLNEDVFLRSKGFCKKFLRL